MSIDLQMTDLEMAREVAIKLGYECSIGIHPVYRSNPAGLGIMLPGWRYPMVITPDGKAVYDNYNGSWGDIQELYAFSAHYGLEKAKEEAYKNCHTPIDMESEDPNILELHIMVN